MENLENRTKKWIFYGMLAAGILYAISIPISYLENSSFSFTDIFITVLFIVFAFMYKFQQKI